MRAARPGDGRAGGLLAREARRVLGYTIAAEIGDIERFASPKKLREMSPARHPQRARGP